MGAGRAQEGRNFVSRRGLDVFLSVMYVCMNNRGIRFRRYTAWFTFDTQYG